MFLVLTRSSPTESISGVPEVRQRSRGHGRRADNEIIRLGEELVVGLVVVGNKVKSTIERALMGSDAGSIARYFRYPVLVVRGR
jgi:nucleotide-binding universal stress UspA family protein